MWSQSSTELCLVRSKEKGNWTSWDLGPNCDLDWENEINQRVRVTCRCFWVLPFNGFFDMYECSLLGFGII